MNASEIALYKCDCCGCMVPSIGSSVWHGGDRICNPCFCIWYDEGITDKSKLKARRLELCGTDGEWGVRHERE